MKLPKRFGHVHGNISKVGSVVFYKLIRIVNVVIFKIRNNHMIFYSNTNRDPDWFSVFLIVGVLKF